MAPEPAREHSHAGGVFVYFGSLTLHLCLVAPSYPLLDIPVSFILKNQLHASTAQVSTFRLLVSVPI
jgi:hypothetical protein